MTDDVTSRTVENPGRILRFLQKSLVLGSLTLIAFLILNVAAHLLFLNFRSSRTNLFRGEYFVAPSSTEGLRLLRKILQTEDEEWIRALAAEDPGISPHTVLHFTTGPSRGPYRLGVERIRYEPGWTDEEVRDWLAAPAETDYVFGGSTTFGQGVPGHETLVAAMNRLRSGGRYLNFAALAYDSLRETDLLLHLLRKGYRPRRVIFVDGLNDPITFCESPFPPHEKPRMQALLMDRGEIPLVYGYPGRNNMVSAFAFAFPVVQLAKRLQAESVGKRDYDNGYVELHAMDWPRMLYFHERWENLQSARAPAVADEWARYFREHIDFVRQLGKAFGFESAFVYQPIGLLEDGHPFLKPAFLKSPTREIFSVFDRVVREEIRSGMLEMIDCSRAIADSGQISLAYVDATHYSPLGNQLLARCIEEKIRPSD